MIVGKGTIRAGQNLKLKNTDLKFKTKFKIQKYYQHKTKFNGVFSRNSLPKIKVGVCVINLGEYKSIGTHWTALHVN